jgi:hypothetical protein
VIRAVDNKRLDLNAEEHKYYLSLVENFGHKDFAGLFTTDKNGQITSITPPIDRQISLGVIFFILNVMMNQRLRALGSLIEKNEEKVAESHSEDNIQERLERVEKQLQAILGEKAQ